MKRPQHLAFGLLTLLALIFAGCKDECKDVTCLNGGTCIEGTCECADGYEGVDCGVEERAKFLGDYDVAQVCTNSNSYSAMITPKPGTVDQIEFSDFANFAAQEIIFAIVEGESLTIPSQAFDGGTVEGSGMIDDSGVITLTYNTFGISCTETFTKQ